MAKVLLHIEVADHGVLDSLFSCILALLPKGLVSVLMVDGHRLDPHWRYTERG